jgi:hypothetical protein
LSPTVTSSFLAGLAPGSAAVKLFARSLQLDFAGEGAPHPVVDGSTNAATVGPVKKILIGAGITEELQNANPETATAIIGRVLSEAAAKSLDAYVFDNVAGDAVRPPGLLNGVTPIAATAGGGTNAMAKDLANIAGVMSDAGVGAETMVIVANPRQAVTLRLISGPNFAYPIFSTVGLAAGTVVGVEAAAIASGFDGAPEIEIGRGGLLHFADTQPQQIGTPGTPNVVAAPTLSPFQQAMLMLKLRLNLAWASCKSGPPAPRECRRKLFLWKVAQISRNPAEFRGTRASPIGRPPSQQRGCDWRYAAPRRSAADAASKNANSLGSQRRSIASRTIQSRPCIRTSSPVRCSRNCDGS